MAKKKKLELSNMDDLYYLTIVEDWQEGDLDKVRGAFDNTMTLPKEIARFFVYASNNMSFSEFKKLAQFISESIEEEE